MIRYDPTERGFGELFVYASCHWLDYLGAVDEANLPSLRNIEAVCMAGSTRLSNWTKQNCRPGCVVKPRFEFDSKLYDPLGIVSLKGSNAMLHHMVTLSDFADDIFLPNSIIAATEQILRWGDLARLRTLVLEKRLQLPLPIVDFWSLILEHWSNLSERQRDWDVVFALVDHMAAELMQENCANELLCLAARAGCLPLIRRIFDHGQLDRSFRSEFLFNFRHEQQFSRPGKSQHQSIGEAILGNHVGVVEFLLQQDGLERHLTYVNAHNETVLHLASIHCNPTILRLLAPCFPLGQDQMDDQGRSALVRVISSFASLRNRLESAEILLTSYAASNSGHGSGDHDSINPLSVAVQLGDLQMCSLLMNAGSANPRSALTRDPDDQLALRYETPENADTRLAILQLLTTHAHMYNALQ